jgi:NO-binding membrane sensor protein with MHYT domain
VPHFGQKVVLVLTVINGAVLNSFVTLSMLSQLQMSQSEQSSYWLFKKIQTR